MDRQNPEMHVPPPASPETQRVADLFDDLLEEAKEVSRVITERVRRTMAGAPPPKDPDGPEPGGPRRTGVSPASP